MKVHVLKIDNNKKKTACKYHLFKHLIGVLLLPTDIFRLTVKDTHELSKTMHYVTYDNTGFTFSCAFDFVIDSFFFYYPKKCYCL